MWQCVEHMLTRVVAYCVMSVLLTSKRLQTLVNLRPDMSLSEKTSVVASPVAAGPAGTLIQELDVVLESRLDLALLVILDPGLPLIRD